MILKSIEINVLRNILLISTPDIVYKFGWIKCSRNSDFFLLRYKYRFLLDEQIN